MPKNLIIFYTDQQRKDSLGCYDNPVARTSNIDALARRGMDFHNHYAANQVCMPSRASFLTGRHLQAHRLIDNGIPLPKTEKTLADVLGEHGYRTRSIGKIHLTPMGAPAETGCEESWAVWQSGRMDGWNGPYYGFQDVRLTMGHGDACFACGGHYGSWVRENFSEVWETAEDYRTGKIRQFGLSALPVEAHHSTWVANESIEFLRNAKDTPFFLFASFPNPHHPFVAPEQYFSMFDDCRFPDPRRREGENDRKPFHYKRAMTERQHPIDGGAHHPHYMTEDDWRKTFAATYAMVAQIDDNVGRVLQCLRDEGLENNTTVAFTSDHGDLLGDHYFLLKGPYPCRSLLNVPFIVADPESSPGESDAVMSNVDAAPTFLDLLGIPIPEYMQGRSFKDVVAGQAGDDDHCALCSGWSKDSPIYYHQTLYGRKYRISYFPNQDDGELYDLGNDPDEFENLYHEPAHGAVRDEMLLRLLKELGRAEPPKLPAVAWW